MSKRKPDPSPDPAPYGTLPADEMTGKTEHPEWQQFVYNGLLRIHNEIAAKGGPETYRTFVLTAASAIAHGDEADIFYEGRAMLFRRFVFPYYDDLVNRNAAKREAGQQATDAAKATDEAKTLGRWFGLDAPSEGGAR